MKSLLSLVFGKLWGMLSYPTPNSWRRIKGLVSLQLVEVKAPHTPNHEWVGSMGSSSNCRSLRSYGGSVIEIPHEEK